jgi:D-tyrosyl-tRNA(Tyr) deacylase
MMEFLGTIFVTIAWMRLVIQRVNNASVEVKDKVVGEIKKGLFVLVGIKKGDTEKEAGALAEKLSKLRVMADENDKMNLCVKDLGADILVVSQFTLYGDTSGGNRPSFIAAALPDEARKIYEHFLARLRRLGVKFETGSFGDYMQIKTDLDGPVTIILEN